MNKRIKSWESKILLWNVCWLENYRNGKLSDRKQVRCLFVSELLLFQTDFILSELWETEQEAWNTGFKLMKKTAWVRNGMVFINNRINKYYLLSGHWRVWKWFVSLNAVSSKLPNHQNPTFFKSIFRNN